MSFVSEDLLRHSFKLIREYKEVIEDYTGNRYYSDFNSYCREGKYDDDMLQKMMFMENNFHDIFQGIEPLTYPITVFRGVNHITDDLDTILENYSKMYISTSISIDNAFQFCGSAEDIKNGKSELMQIDIMPGSKVLFIALDNHRLQAESEVLINKGGQLIDLQENTYHWKRIGKGY